jgi:signal transduction histidine kinase
MTVYTLPPNRHQLIDWGLPSPAMLDLVQDMIAIICITDRRIVYMNRAGRKLLGLNSMEPLPPHTELRGLINPTHIPKLQHALLQANAPRNWTWSGDIEMISRADEHIPMRVNVLVPAEKPSTKDYRILVAQDTRSEMQMVDMRHEVTVLTTFRDTVMQRCAEMINWLRNPLTVVFSRLYLLNHSLTTDAQRNQLDRVFGSMKRLQHLIADMSTWFRLENTPALAARRIEVSSVLGHVVDSLRESAAERQVELTMEPASSPYFVQASVVDLQQAFIEVLENAIEFNRPDGYVRIRLRQNGDHLDVFIMDTGRGIPKDEQAQVFHWLRNTGSPQGTSGLGLAISKRIVELHQGTITLHSTPKGTTVRIRLPLVN